MQIKPLRRKMQKEREKDNIKVLELNPVRYDFPFVLEFTKVRKITKIRPLSTFVLLSKSNQKYKIV